MRTRLLFGMMMLAMLMVFCGSPKGFAGEEDRAKNMENLLEQAVDYFQLNRYIEAKAALDKLLTEKPSDEEAWKLRKAFGARVLHEMHAWMEKGRSLGEGPLAILAGAQRFDQSQLMDKATIERIVSEAVRNPEANGGKALVEISSLGQFAVPELIEYLRNKQNDAARANAAYILTHLGPQVVNPLCEALSGTTEVLLDEKKALKVDMLLVQQLCQILMDIRPMDARSLPYIKRIYDIEKTRQAEGGALSPLGTWTAKALETITGKPVASLLSADEYYLSEANRYYMGGPAIDEEMDDLQETFWVWNPAGGRVAGSGGLESIAVPAFALDEMLAENLLYEGMNIGADKKRFEVLLSSVLLQQASENNMLVAIAEFYEPSLPDAAKMRESITAWAERLGRVQNEKGAATSYLNENIAYALGSNMLVSVLEKSLMDNKDDVAVLAIEGVEKVGGENGWSIVAGWQRPAAPVAPAAPEQKADTKPAVPAKQTPPAAPAPKKAKKAEKLVKAEKGKATAEVAPVTNPLLSALGSPIPRIRQTAANCLVRIGLPETHAAYAQVKDVLAEGACEEEKVVCLVISNDTTRRMEFDKMLTEKGVAGMGVPEGREGYRLATEYPPKDAILIDSNIHEFQQLRNRLALREVVTNSVLPVTIISISSRADLIANQFKREVKGKYMDDPSWSVTVINNASPDDQRVFENLRSIKSYANEAQPVVILTNESRQDRLRLKSALLLSAERAARPERLTQLARLRNEKKVLNDIWGTRSIFSNIYLDEELSGFDVMRTVQKLREDPRTRPVPIGIIAPQERAETLAAEFKHFTENGGSVHILPDNIGSEDLKEKVKAMVDQNPISQAKYTRVVRDRIAEKSSEGLQLLDLKKTGLQLTAEQVEGLRRVVSSEHSSMRPASLRAAAALALGHFGVQSVSKTLQATFIEEDKAEVDLRVACMKALGLCDKENRFREIKEKALGENGYEGYEKVQVAAAQALAASSSFDHGLRKTVLDLYRPNNPLKMLPGGGAVEEAAPAATTEEAAPAAEPAAEPEAAPADTTDDDDSSDGDDDDDEDLGGGW